MKWKCLTGFTRFIYLDLNRGAELSLESPAKEEHNYLSLYSFQFINNVSGFILFNA